VGDEKEMNTNLLNVVKQIIAGNGEAVLANPQRLKAFFSDLAKDEPKPLRIAFDRCIEAGAYTALKTAPDAMERAAHKALLVPKVHEEHGLDIGLCNEALDILEAALFAAAPRKKVCAKCGEELRESWKLCPNCGNAVAGVSEHIPVVPVKNSPAVTPARPPAPVADKRKRNIVGFCFGIIFLLFVVLFPKMSDIIFYTIGIPLDVTGFCLSISGVKKRAPYKGLGITGIVLNGYSVLVFVLMIIGNIVKFLTG
jgi:hypothetical protein